jgi:anti-sigma-K factor RskA
MTMFDWTVTHKLDRVAKRAAPDRIFVRSVRQRLELHGMPTTRLAHWKITAASLSSVAILFAGTGAYAYTSDNVLPDNPLYPVRQLVERGESSLAFSDSHRAAVHLQHVRRRVHEQKLLNMRKHQLTLKHMTHFMGEMEATLKTSAHLPELEQEKVDAALGEADQEFAHALVDVEGQELVHAHRQKLDELLGRLQGAQRQRFEHAIDRRDR